MTPYPTEFHEGGRDGHSLGQVLRDDSRTPDTIYLFFTISSFFGPLIDAVALSFDLIEILTGAIAADMEDKGCVIYGVAISFLSLSYIVVALRCYVRLKLTRWGLDDIFAIIALVRGRLPSENAPVSLYGLALSFHGREAANCRLVCVANDPFIVLQCMFTAITSFLMRSASFGLGKRTKAVASLDAFTEAVKVRSENLGAAENL